MYLLARRGIWDLSTVMNATERNATGSRGYCSRGNCDQSPLYRSQSHTSITSLRCAGQAGDCAFVNQGVESFAESCAGGADVPRQGGFGWDVAADIVL